jgi:rubrerythrin
MVPTDREREIQGRARAAAERLAALPLPGLSVPFRREVYLSEVACVIVEEMEKLMVTSDPAEIKSGNVVVCRCCGYHCDPSLGVCTHCGAPTMGVRK